MPKPEYLGRHFLATAILKPNGFYACEFLTHDLLSKVELGVKNHENIEYVDAWLDGGRMAMEIKMKGGKITRQIASSDPLA